jgi:type II secretory ATPase GspE/PulE/Tfp pilus assembly ATPase PilB-like protein
MIGEIRDRETAATAIEAALTGHLVFSTLHAGSACGVVGRLLEMGVEPYLLTSGLKGILNQRLVRRLCERCRQPIEQPGGSVGWRTVGCAACVGTGYQSRMLLAELLKPDAALRQAILNRADTVGLEAAAIRPDRQTIWSAADQAVAQGLTTPAEIERVLGPRPA